MTAAPAERPWGITALAVFFACGAIIAAATGLALGVPGRTADLLWRLKPSAQLDLLVLGTWAAPLMTLVSAGCAVAAIGLWRERRWGHVVALAVLTTNLFGDLVNAVLRADWRTLLGLPIGGLMILYLLRPPVRARFRPSTGDQPSRV